MVPQVQGSQNNTRTLASTGTISHIKTMAVGVNYLSAYNMYSSVYSSNNVLERDFAKFKTDGIEVIGLSLYWNCIEGNTRGDYKNNFLDNIKRVIQTANNNGIKVLVTFHTLWGTDDSPWCTPDYVIDPETGGNIGLAIVRSDEMKEGFVELFTYTVRYLTGTPGIVGWAVLNEPWYWGRTSTESDFITNNGKTQKENFIELFQDLSNIIKTIDGNPVTIRFSNAHISTRDDGTQVIRNIFVDQWGWDQRIVDSLDFMSFNSYVPTNSQLEETWQDITTANVLTSNAKNKQVWITEFGSALTDDTGQANAFNKMLSLFMKLPIEKCIAWLWATGDIPSNWHDAILNSNYNLCEDPSQGTGTPAYDKLCLIAKQK
jgi:arabinogalactan endo-1,4-beta-galactosidase